MKSLAINVAANDNDPGNRGPIFADGSFRYVPIEESVSDEVSEPTFEQLGLAEYVPDDMEQAVAHFDPEFPEYNYGQAYTYGDRHGTKVSRINDLNAGDVLFFYGTFDYWGAGPSDHDWIAEDWAAYIFGHFTLAEDPISGDEYRQMTADSQAQFANNAHVRREPFDAKVLVLGDDELSQLYNRAIPLGNGTDANRIVTELSSDSGKGPWFRRPMNFDEDATAELLDTVNSGCVASLLG